MEKLPAALQLAYEQITGWERRWHKATRGAPIGFDEARDVVAVFIDPVLRDSVTGQECNAAERRWT